MSLKENSATHIDEQSKSSIRTWRHEMICRLMDAGITDHHQIKETVNGLFDLVTAPSPTLHQVPKHYSPDVETTQVRTEGILHGTDVLDRLRNFVYLLEDEKRFLNQK